MIFQWVEGKSVFPQEINKKHCEIIGDILGKMHGLNIALDELKAEEDGEPMYEWDKVIAGSYAGMLGWLEYNVKRALGIEASDDEEIRLGIEQVKGTINALYDYQAKAELLKDWLKRE